MGSSWREPIVVTWSDLHFKRITRAASMEHKKQKPGGELEVIIVDQVGHSSGLDQVGGCSGSEKHQIVPLPCFKTRSFSSMPNSLPPLGLFPLAGWRFPRYLTAFRPPPKYTSSEVYFSQHLEFGARSPLLSRSLSLLIFIYSLYHSLFYLLFTCFYPWLSLEGRLHEDWGSARCCIIRPQASACKQTLNRSLWNTNEALGW